MATHRGGTEQLMNYNRMHDWLVEYLSELRTVVVPMPFTTYTYIADPANVEHGETYHSYMEVLGNGIFNVDGELWKKQRKTASFEFASKNLRDFSTVVFREYSLKLHSILTKASFHNQEVDMQDLLMRMTLDSICRFIDPLWKLKRFINVGSEALLGKSIQCHKEKKTEIKETRNLANLLKAFEEVQAEREDFIVITETLRLYPAVPQDPKGILEDDILPDGTKVKAGGMVTYFPYSMGRMEYIGDLMQPYSGRRDGSKRDTSRMHLHSSSLHFSIICNRSYLRELSNLSKETLSLCCNIVANWFLFSDDMQAGPRNGLGKDSAYLQMKMALAILCRSAALRLLHKGKGNKLCQRSVMKPLKNGDESIEEL
ncbi:CYP704B1 protein [Hibiscus syriacus]|uniref:CYP704B1 protein n=1 Tax=Hibiscus syriacus TaxID=106335 RepID=A0A6A3CBP6_HIBSY|nr:CYP704B1 protein [Hibiscus syriacus]